MIPESVNFELNRSIESLASTQTRIGYESWPTIGLRIPDWRNEFRAPVVHNKERLIQSFVFLAPQLVFDQSLAAFFTEDKSAKTPLAALTEIFWFLA